MAKKETRYTVGSEIETFNTVVSEPVAPSLQARELPGQSGVYLMKDKDDRIIYVGKAKDLRKRVTSYFLANRSAKTAALVRKIVTIEYIITGNEYEALVLENNLIKKYAPHYNISLKDGKSYPVIRITNEPFPKVLKTRQIINDGSTYYGPYPGARMLEQYLDLIYKLFPLRYCSTPLRKREKPCLYYHIGLCSGPCAGLIGAEEYGRYITEVRNLLEGKVDGLLTQLHEEMTKASRELRFEEAATKRDQAETVKMISTDQQVQEFSEENRDYAAIEMRGPLCTISLMQMREGQVIGRALYRAETFGDETETLLAFLIQYYADGMKLPQYLYVSHEIEVDLIRRYFLEHFGGILEVSLPIEGKHYRILRMARENATRDVEKRLRNKDNTEALHLLKELLGLESEPVLIEGFDVSHLQGKYTVASLISFRNGNPDKPNYRRYNIKSVEGRIDDYDSIREAVARRYQKVLNENLERPGLLLIDGGHGQVNAAREVLDDLGIFDIPVIGLIEGSETIVFGDGKEDLRLDHGNEALRLLIAVRDECHRFAHASNQAARSRTASFQLLQSVDGIGKKRSEALMAQYGSLEAVLKKDPEDLAKEAKLPLAVAQRLIKQLSL
ncbi:MAG TPA: excinuclease ABC subunit UvrC [Sphaerochaeta sp.]|nr:excinuclease ABC subunit UvrC [Spirochaetota bacterium]HPB41999.1 excinuclease ABC subunit UvrC [Sphaerochaeta sp.]HPY44560.1 excinuclease ABC subunit UvrC [Sphaerochaeta sp.]HQB04623.1 excinuclease ABC subunit UvrC [Sphaerochaeta sp.]